MNNSIEKELLSHLIVVAETIDDDFEELHDIAFNQDYYIISYYEANEWLKKHDVDAFEAIAYVIEQHQHNFGEIQLNVNNINSEYIVNQLVYFAGYDVMPSDLSISKEDLLKELENMLASYD